MSKIPFSKIIAGNMTWEIWGKKCNTEQMISLMNSFLESGISLDSQYWK